MPHLALLNRCVVIDFGRSRLRFPDETDEEWRLNKMEKDEDGQVGFGCEIHLRDLLKDGSSCESRSFGLQTDARRADTRLPADGEKETIYEHTSTSRWDPPLTAEELELDKLALR